MHWRFPIASKKTGPKNISLQTRRVVAEVTGPKPFIYTKCANQQREGKKVPKKLFKWTRPIASKKTGPKEIFHSKWAE